jgi:hypothetical protein
VAAPLPLNPACRYCEIAGYLAEDGWDDAAADWHDRCKDRGCGCDHGRYVLTEQRLRHPAVPHPVHLRLRAEALRYEKGLQGKVAAGNDWLATHLAVVFGVAWTIWVFFIVPVVAYFLPQAVQNKIFFFSSGWIQLFALPLMVYVGNKLQRSSDAQSEAMTLALTHIATVSDQNKTLIEQNTELTAQVHSLVTALGSPVPPATG